MNVLDYKSPKGKTYMKINEETVFCACHSLEHQFTFRFFEDKYEPEMYFSIHLSRQSFPSRLKSAIKHIFGYQCKYGDWDEVCLYKQQAVQIRDCMNLFLEKHSEWQEKWNKVQ